MGKRYWVIKTEPGEYSYADLARDGRTAWTGIRNFEARNNLRAMQVGDLCLVYHSGSEKALVGVAKVLGAAKDDETAPGQGWVSVDIGSVKPLEQPIALSTLKADRELSMLPLVTRSRLSVTPVSPAQMKAVMRVAKTKLA